MAGAPRESRLPKAGAGGAWAGFKPRFGHLSRRPRFPSLWRRVRPAAPRERREARAELTSGQTEGVGRRGLQNEGQVPCPSRGPAADHPLSLWGPQNLTCQGHSPLGHTLPPTIRPWGLLPFLFSRTGIFPHGYSTAENKSSAGSSCPMVSWGGLGSEGCPGKGHPCGSSCRNGGPSLWKLGSARSPGE